ncbi:MAG: N-acetylmuramoyl-L-alanine amidase [Bacteroidales bacterium]|nr:N-acetylmuramoyl-L-alanine amidase [Bacteroidales bacterium]
MNSMLRRIIRVLAALLLAIPVPARAQGKVQDGLTLKTVIIDPGHGGKDAGCVSRDKKTYEKNIVLDIGQRLAGKIRAAYPEVTVKMTRDDDTFVELENRAVIANKAGGDLFISIHVNSVEKGTTANGYSIHCLGQSSRKGNDLFSKNLDLVKRENSVIMLEDNYQSTYQGFDPTDPQSSIIFSLVQNAHLGSSLTFADYVAKAMGSSPIRGSRGVSQDPFWVLWRTAMPAVLIEVGFITNPDDLATLRSEKGRDEIAANIFKAFSQFKAGYDGSMPAQPVPEATAVPAPQKPRKETPAAPSAPASDQAGILYGTQVLVSGKERDLSDPFFRGYEPLHLLAGRYNKYIIGTSASLEEAKEFYRSVRSLFTDAYLVKIENGATSPVH